MPVPDAQTCRHAWSKLHQHADGHSDGAGQPEGVHVDCDQIVGE